LGCKANVRENPFVDKELFAGDHFAGTVGIISLPTMGDCAGVMSSWPNAVASEYKYEDSASMFSGLFFQIANDHFTFGEEYKTNTHVKEKNHPLTATYANEKDAENLWKLRALLASAAGDAVDNLIGKQQRKQRIISSFLSLMQTQPFSLQMEGLPTTSLSPIISYRLSLFRILWPNRTKFGVRRTQFTSMMQDTSPVSTPPLNSMMLESMYLTNYSATAMLIFLALGLKSSSRSLLAKETSPQALYYQEGCQIMSLVVKKVSILNAYYNTIWMGKGESTPSGTS
jgi:hypothetical protein